MLNIESAVDARLQMDSLTILPHMRPKIVGIQLL
jgi:hypothetical protein